MTRHPLLVDAVADAVEVAALSDVYRCEFNSTLPSLACSGPAAGANVMKETDAETRGHGSLCLHQPEQRLEKRKKKCRDYS